MKIIKQTPEYLPLNNVELTTGELLDCYSCVFPSVHSVGFMTAEIKDLLFEPDYWFNESPILNWEEKLKIKLIELNKIKPS